MTTTTTTPEAEAAASSPQRIPITTDLTLTLTTPTIHNSVVTSASLTGTWLWPSSLLLSHYLSTHVPPSYFADKYVLELGAGYSGLPGLTAARLGARHVTLTDIPKIVPLLLQNAAFNEPGAVEVRSLVWGEDEEEEHNEEDYKHADEDYDSVLMSDVFYDVEMMEKHGRTVRRVCRETTRVFGATQLRQWTWECLIELEKGGFELVKLGVFRCCNKLWTGLKGTADEHFAVFEFLKKRAANKIVN